jgi:hypothetical protein
MASTKQRQEAAKQARKAAKLMIGVQTILQAVTATAKLAISHGIKLNDEGIFDDEDCVVYKYAANDLISKGYPYKALLQALEAHDKLINDATGVDFSKYNGDWSLLHNRKGFSADMNAVTEQLRIESAILNGINGTYSMRGMNPYFQMQFVG